MSDKVKGIAQLIAVMAFIAGSVLVSLLLQSTYEPPQTRSAEDRPLYVSTETINTGDYRITFETTGIVGARAEISIVPEVSGRVMEINDSFFEGGVFEKDEVLFRINPKDFELAVEQLEAEIARAETVLDLAKAESEAALAEWKIVNGNMEAPALVARKPQMAEAQANLRAAKAQLANAQLDLERSSFSFPFKGRVLSGNLEEGQYVATGQNYGSVFDTGSLEVRAALEDRRLEWLMTADKTDIEIIARYLGQTKIYDGFLKRGAASLNAETRFATVAFGFAQEITDLLPGIFTTIRVKGPVHRNITRIPASAMQKEGMIWLVNGDNTITAHIPDILFSGDDHIAVRGLEDSVRVVTSRVSGASSGMKIKTDESVNRNESDGKKDN